MNDLKVVILDEGRILINGEEFRTIDRLSKDFKMIRETIRYAVRSKGIKTVRLGKTWVSYWDFLKKYVGVDV